MWDIMELPNQNLEQQKEILLMIVAVATEFCEMMQKRVGATQRRNPRVERCPLPRFMCINAEKHYIPQHVTLGYLNYDDARLKDTLSQIEEVKTAAIHRHRHSLAPLKRCLLHFVCSKMKAFLSENMEDDIIGQCDFGGSKEDLPRELKLLDKEFRSAQVFYGVHDKYMEKYSFLFNFMILRDASFVLLTMIRSASFPSSLKIEVLLLQNQLPLSLIRFMYSGKESEFSDLVYNFMQQVLPFTSPFLPLLEVPHISTDPPRYLPDLLSYAYRCVAEVNGSAGSSCESSDPRNDICYSKMGEKRPCASELEKNFYTFRPSLGTGISAIRFCEASKTLWLPRIRLGCETQWRNLLAHEYFFESDHLVSSFLYFLDDLIVTRRDLEIFVRSGIVVCSGDRRISDKDFDEFKAVCQLGTRERCEAIEKTSYAIMICYEGRKWSPVKSLLYSATETSRMIGDHVTNNSWVGFSAVAAILLVFMTSLQVYCLFYECSKRGHILYYSCVAMSSTGVLIITLLLFAAYRGLDSVFLLATSDLPPPYFPSASHNPMGDGRWLFLGRDGART